MMRKYGILLSLIALSLSAAESSFSNGRLTLSNERLIAEIDPAHGGKLVRLYDKRTRTELTTLSNTPGGSGLFSEGLYEPGTSKINKIYQKKRYSLTYHQSGVIATATLRSPKGLPLTIEKTYSLKDGSDTLNVTYELTNPQEKNYIGALYLNNCIRIPGETQYKVAFPEGRSSDGWKRDWKPGEKQSRNRFLYEPGKSRSANQFVYFPIRDYVLLAGKKAGAVLEVPFPFLDFFYSYFGPGADSFAIADWFTIPFQLQPLSKGKREAVLLTVLDDPLAAYKLRFTTGVKVVDVQNFVYERYRAPSKQKKSEDFAPRVAAGRMMTDFRLPAVIREQKPLRKIKLAAVAITPGNPEMGELNRRLNMDMDLVDASTSGFKPSPHFGWKIPMPEMALRPILEKNPQIILMTGHDEKNFPDNLKQKLKSLVENGAAFIYVARQNRFPSLIPAKGGKDLPSDLFRGMRKEDLPGFGPVKEFKRGKGKVIHVQFNTTPHNIGWIQDSRAVIPYVEIHKENFPYWEYYFSFYGRLFRYAAGIHSPASIRTVGMKDGKAQLEILAHKAVSSAAVSLTLDTPGGRVPQKVLWKGNLRKGINKLTLALPAGKVFRSGEYLLFFSLSAPQGTLDWFDTCFKHRGQAEIISLTPEKRVFGKEESVKGQLEIAGQGKLILRLREAATGRVAARQVFPKAKGKIRFQLKRDFAFWHKLYIIEAEVRCAEKIAASAVRNVLIRPARKNPEAILPMIWAPHLTSWLDRTLSKDLSEAGFRIYESPVALRKTTAEFVRECDDALLYGMDYAPLGIEHMHASRPARRPYKIRSKCLRNPSNHKTFRMRAQEINRRMALTLSDYCFIADEITLGYLVEAPHDFCFSPWCLSAFRQAMKKKYGGDLKKLNRNWKTAFTSWDKIMPDTREEAAKRGHFTSCQEHRVFMMDNLPSACKIIADIVKKGGSGAKIGVSGMPNNVYQGYDQSVGMSFLNCAAIYHTPFILDQMRSGAKPDQMIGSYTDYGTRYKVLEQLIAGFKMPSVWWYGHLIRRGDGRLSAEGEHLKKMFASIRDSGAEHILGYGQRKKSPVTLVWSAPSMVAGEVGKSVEPVTGRNYSLALDSWSQLIRDLGMDMPNVLTDQELNKLSPSVHPIVVLPCTLRLSDANIKLLERYVRAGGTLIADLYPGRFDDFGVIRKNNPLYRLFGIRDMGTRILPEPSLSIDGHHFPFILLGSKLTISPDVKPCQAIQRKFKGARLGTMRLADSNRTLAPAFLLRKNGKGKTLYLNFFFDRYSTFYSNSELQSNQIRDIMRDVFQLAGMEMKKAHQVPIASSYAEYKIGGVRYWFLSRRATNAGGEFVLKADKPMHLYDLMQGKYLGKADRLQDNLPGNDMRLIGLFPEKLGRFSGKIEFDGRKIRIRAERKHSDFQEPLRLRVFHNGQERQIFARTLLLRDKLQHEVDLGLEPARGSWQVILSAVADGRKIENRFNIAK